MSSTLSKNALFINTKKVGAGAYGDVFYAERLNPENPQKVDRVAIKKIKIAKIDEGINRSAVAEIKSMTELHHENLMPILDIIYHDHNVHLVIPWCESDLSKLILKDTFLQTSHIKCIMKQILLGLKYLHKSQVIHRDMKPDNIMITEKGDCLIADFGLAIPFNETDFYGEALPMSSAAGTPAFRAPELCLGSEFYDEKVDIFATGCIFGQILLKRLMFPSDSDINRLEILAKVLGGPAENIEWKGVSLSQVKSVLPDSSRKAVEGLSIKELFPAAKEVEIDFLMRMIDWDPKKRWSAEELLNHDYFKTSPFASEKSELPIVKKKEEFGAQIFSEKGDDMITASFGVKSPIFFTEKEKKEETIFMETDTSPTLNLNI